MAYDSRVYRVLIASPSDVEEERDIAVKVIQEWNDLYSYSRKVTLLPLRWETHTAPEYGTRPQEVINRAIVDECDLLVGIFWTRIGSPSGVADSGTIEEIERVGKVGKPIMLYFSRVEIDPEKIATEQIEKLKRFKELTYPKGLVENYRKIIEFRDKFSKQLELKVRDLQRSDALGTIPLSLKFLSVDGQSIDQNLELSVDRWEVDNFNDVPKARRDALKELVFPALKAHSAFPIAMIIENLSTSGVRNLFVELEISKKSGNVELSATPFRVPSSSSAAAAWSHVITLEALKLGKKIELNIARQNVQLNLGRFREEGLQEVDGGWKLSFEWDALQPQRTRLIEPVLYCYSPGAAELSVAAKVYADSFPEPLTLTARLVVTVRVHSKALSEVLPDWKHLISN